MINHNNCEESVDKTFVKFAASFKSIFSGKNEKEIN